VVPGKRTYEGYSTVRSSARRLLCQSWKRVEETERHSCQICCYCETPIL
jgi:hypothetical protein